MKQKTVKNYARREKTEQVLKKLIARTIAADRMKQKEERK